MPSAVEYIRNAYNQQVRAMDRRPTKLLVTSGWMDAYMRELAVSARYIDQGRQILFRNIPVSVGMHTAGFGHIWIYGPPHDQVVRVDQPEPEDDVTDVSFD